MKIAVMAGTPIDSKLGTGLLNSYGYDDVVLVPISNNPVEQTNVSSIRRRRTWKYYCKNYWWTKGERLLCNFCIL